MSKPSTAISKLLRYPSLLRSHGCIGGTWTKTPSSFPVYNPASGEEIHRVHGMNKDEAGNAVTTAHEAFSKWKKRPAKDRSRIVRRWCELILEHQDDLATLVTLEQGKPLNEAKGEVVYAAAFVEWSAEEAKRVYGDVIPAPSADRRTLVLKQPVGVAALWSPWNFPVSMTTRKAAPALAAGCSVIIKPSWETPLSVLALQQLAEEAGFPDGVVNTVVCEKKNIETVTDTILGSDLVTAFSLTGSTETGKLLTKKCVDTMKMVSLELGGNAAFLVFDSADIDRAVDGAMKSKFRNTGQACICTNRFLIQDGVYDEFAAKLVEAVNTQLKIGPGLDPDSTQGPLINDSAVEKVMRHVEDAVAKGAQVLTGGGRHELGGQFFQPTVLGNATQDMSVFRQETFGPVAPLFRFKTEQEAISMANDTEYGLAGYIFSRDYAQIWRVSEELEIGVCGVNEGMVTNDAAPWGGWKSSGLGREGYRGIEDFLEEKYICVGGIEPLDNNS